MSNLLKTYSLSFKGKNNGEKDYELKFKVANGVNVRFNQVGDVYEVHLDSVKENTTSNEKSRNYKVTGPLNIQFFEYPVAGAGKDGGNVAGGKPIVIIGVQP